jgi:hypothetical protein
MNYDWSAKSIDSSQNIAKETLDAKGFFFLENNKMDIVSFCTMK